MKNDLQICDPLLPKDKLDKNDTSDFEFKETNSNKKEEEDFYDKLIHEGSISGSVVCILCLTFGSGILALPYSFKKAGVILGLILFAWASFSVYWTLRLMTKVSYKIGTFDYAELIMKLYGKKKLFLFNLMNLIGNLGAIIVYQQIISNFFFSFLKYCNITIFDEFPNLSRFIQMYSFSIFTQIPLTFIKNISGLQKLSVFGTIALFYTVIVAILETPFYFKANYSPEKINYFTFDFNSVKILCMFYFSYANHNAILHVFNEVKDTNKEKGNKIVKYSFIMEVITYSAVLFSGYFSTFDETNEIFIDREGQSVFLVIGKLFYIFSLTCIIGINYCISRQSIETVFNGGNKFSEKENIYFGIFLTLFLNTLAYYFRSISTTISILGGTADLYLIFVMPVMLYLAYKPKRDWKRYLSVFIMILSIIIGTTFVIVAFLENFITIL